ncbi:MAG TPA: hypothetical protein ENK50_01140 [Sedimenticola sp.]|nr:hypothetical protein [Sedimenticola sp.]
MKRRPGGRLPGLLLGLLLALPVLGGGGPETTLVVVNGASPLSLAVANAYARLRQIPTRHLLFLEEIPSLDSIDTDLFLQRIWKPTRDYLKQAGLSGQIDTIAYSSDFPYDVDFKKQLRRLKAPKNRLLGRRASLTGLTYYALQLNATNPAYLRQNLYYRRNLSPNRCPPPKDIEKGDLALFEASREQHKSKQFRDAVSGFRQLTRRYPKNRFVWFDLARSLAALGQVDDALEALDRAVSNCWSDTAEMRRDPYLKPLRNHPAFRLLLERMQASYGPFEATRGFSSRYHWARKPTGDDRDRYILSTFLAWTGWQGNSLPEVLRYLASAAASDGSQPQGTVYLMENPNVRSRTRQPLFPATRRALKARGRQVEILSRRQPGQDGILPRNRDDVIGMVGGSQHFDWEASGSRLLPGAIAETLTSYGAHFRLRKQTKLTAHLRHGAAGSSGAVAEPYAMQEKFPLPLLHSYYADGVSLAEAFYQSLRYPYQLLIVGDPLAQPYARFAKVSLRRPDPATPWRGRVRLMPQVQSVEGHPVVRVELWVDGRQQASAAPGIPIDWDTTGFADGDHSLRLVAVEANPIQTRTGLRLQVRLDNRGRRIVLQNPPGTATWGEKITLGGTAAGAQEVVLSRGSLTLARVPVSDGSWRAVVPSERLGIGPVTLVARSHYPEGTGARAQLQLQITPPPPSPALPDDSQRQPGLRVTTIDTAGQREERVIDGLDKGSMKSLTGGGRYRQVEIEGVFRVDGSGFYELVFATRGRIEVEIDDRPLLDKSLGGKHPEGFGGISLQPGWHRLRIVLRPKGRLRFRYLISGATPAFELKDDRVGHLP